MRSNDKNTDCETAGPRSSPWGLAFLLLVGVAGQPACAGNVPSGVRDCPCATGSVCCASGVCAKDQASCTVATSALAAEAKGVWTGYVENFAWASGSDAIKLSFDVQADGTVFGHVNLGSGAVPAPPTDPDDLWPTGQSWKEVGWNPPYIEGFGYTAQDSRWEQRRLRFAVAPDEAWNAWCELQTVTSGPPPDGGGVAYSCGPWSVAPEDDPQCEITNAKICGKWTLCGMGICACDANGCKAALLRTLTFDIALRNGQGDGSVRIVDRDGLQEVVNNIRVTRTGQ